MLWTRGGLVLPRRPPSLIGPMGVSGASQLPRNLTIGGATVQASWIYDGRDLTGSSGSLSWPEHYGAAGATLSEAGGGALTRGNAGPFTDGTTGVLADGVGRLGSSLNVATGTKDLITAVVLDYIYNAAYDQIVLSSRTVPGWQLMWSSGELRPTFYANDGSTGAVAYGPNLISGTWNAVVACVNRSEGSANGALVFSNAAAGTGVDFSAVGSIADGGNLTLLSRPDGTDPMRSGARVVWAGIWLGADIFAAGAAGAAQMQAVASELTSRAFGFYDSLARTGAPYPTITRASTRHFQVGSAFHPVGNGAHGVEEDGGGNKYVSAFAEYTNSCPYSTAVTGWTPGGGGSDVLSDSGVASPISGSNWVRAVEAANSNWHGQYRALAVAPAQNQRVCAQVLCKKGGAAGRRYIGLHLGFTGTGTCGVLLDSSDGSIVDTGYSGDATLHSYGAIPLPAATEAYLLWLVASTAAAVPGALYPLIHMADSATFSEADYDIYAGDPVTYSDGILIAGALVSIGATGPLPCIETAAAAVTKSAEVIELGVADFGIPGSIEMEVRSRDTVPTSKVPWDWYDGSLVTDACIGLYVDASGHLHLYTCNEDSSSEADIEVTTAINDGAWHRVALSWAPDYVRLRVGNTDAIDTSVTLPALANLTKCLLGSSATGCQFDGDIREFRAYPYRRL